MNPPRRRLAALATVLAGVVGLGACTSTPGNKRVVEDIIQSLDVPESVKECMDGVVEVHKDDLDDWADDNEDFGLTPEGELVNVTPELADFQAELAACMDGAAGSEPTGTEPDGTAPDDTASSDTVSSGPGDSAPASSAPDTTLG